MKGENKSNPGRRVVDSVQKNQIAVLRTMSTSARIQESPKKYQLHELTSLSGMDDEKETQRILYILEGQKYVTPSPPGDFTSKIWHITQDGMKAVNVLKENGLV